MARYRLSERARADIIEILARSEDRFGTEARDRYEALIAAALRDVATHRDGPGSAARPEIGPGVFSWHLRLSRNPSEGATVHRPRHFLIYRLDGEVVVIGRVLHDAMELRRHLHRHHTWE